MDRGLLQPNRSNLSQVRTEDLPAQEKMTLDAQDAALLPAEQVYSQRLNETRPDGDLSIPTFVP